MFSLVALLDQRAQNSQKDWQSYWQQWLANQKQALPEQCYWAELDVASQVAARWQRAHRGTIETARLALIDSDLGKLTRFLNPLEALLPAGGALYLCRFSAPLQTPLESTERIAGTLQLCSFNAKQELSELEFERRWLQEHTAIAIETQATTHYRQHRVIRTLRGETLDAIVEEQFPIAAANSLEVFFDAVGNPEKLQQHISSMQRSCARFIDMQTINVIHLSDWPLHIEPEDS
ncbi:MAG: EthD domain-containing protein [Porticoccaceae bacterium]